MDWVFFRFVTMHAFDRRTDRRTDGQTEFPSLYRDCIPCSAVKTRNVIDTGPSLTILDVIAVIFILTIEVLEQRAVTSCDWGVKAGMVRVWVAGVIPLLHSGHICMSAIKRCKFTFLCWTLFSYNCISLRSSQVTNFSWIRESAWVNAVRHCITDDLCSCCYDSAVHFQIIDNATTVVIQLLQLPSYPGNHQFHLACLQCLWTEDTPASGGFRGAAADHAGERSPDLLSCGEGAGCSLTKKPTPLSLGTSGFDSAPLYSKLKSWIRAWRHPSVQDSL